MSSVGPAGGTTHLLQSLRRNNEGAQRALERLSTGKRINRPSDDPSGFVGAEQLRSEIVRLQAELKSVNQSRLGVRQEQSNLAGLAQQLNDLKGLLTSSVGNVVSDDQRKMFDAEIDEALKSVETLRGKAAELKAGAPQTGASPPPKIDASARDAQLAEIVDSQLDSVTLSRAGLAAYEKYHIDVQKELLENLIVTHTEALSQIEDADIAEETSNFAVSQTLAQATQAAIAITGKLDAEQTRALLEGVQESGTTDTVDPAA